MARERRQRGSLKVCRTREGTGGSRRYRQRRARAFSALRINCRPTPRCFVPPGCVYLPACGSQLRPLTRFIPSLCHSCMRAAHLLLYLTVPLLLRPSLSIHFSLRFGLRPPLLPASRPSPIAPSSPRPHSLSILSPFSLHSLSILSLARSIGRRWRSTTRATRSGSPTTKACMT